MVLLRFWPLVIYASMIWLNTDFIIPVLKLSLPSLGLIGLTLVVVPLATLELCYGYWFWGYWLRVSVGELEKFRELRKKIRYEGLLDRWIIDGVLNVYHQTIDPNNKINQRISRWGAWFIWITAVFTPPGFGARSGCAAFCGLFRKSRIFLHLVLANVVHALLAMGLWGLILGK